jgi:DNA-binding transcriptional MerR regulator
MSTTESVQPDSRRLAIRKVRERYDVSGRTIDRWLEQGILPPPIFVRGRRYWELSALEQAERAGMKATRDVTFNPADNLPTATP